MLAVVAHVDDLQALDIAGRVLELVDLEALARDAVYEFAFIAASLKLRGADAAPLRPIAIPLRPAATARNEGR